VKCSYQEYVSLGVEVALQSIPVSHDFVCMCVCTQVHTCCVCGRRGELSGHRVEDPGLVVHSQLGGISEGLSAAGQAGSQQHCPLSRRPTAHSVRARDRGVYKHLGAWLSLNVALDTG